MNVENTGAIVVWCILLAIAIFNYMTTSRRAERLENDSRARHPIGRDDTERADRRRV